MPVTLSVALRACCVALALSVAIARGAEPPNPLLGATKEQVLTRYGEPKSQIAAGDRLIFFYPRERIVFRGDVVVEVEPIIPEPVRRPPPPTAEEANPPSTAAPAETTTGVAPPPGPGPGPTVAPGPGPTATPEAETQTPPPEPKLEIKLVRPPSKDGRPSPAPTTSSSTPSTPEPERPSSTSVAPASAEQAAPQVEPPVTTPPLVTSSPQTSSSPTDPAAATRSSSSAAEIMRAAEIAAKQEQEQRAKAAKEARRRLDEAVAAEQPASSGGGSISPMLVIGAVLVAGVGFLIWRFRQRQVELAATSVMNTPAPSAAPVRPSGNQFTAEFLDSLEWKRFEELVAAYYNKTGVVATRTNTGPQSPVHLKISWKGEARPFAYVQCIAHPSGLVEAKPLKEFVAALAADGIRRGYVVTLGKFSVPARDIAEEKQLTLLPGDLFLEKLNALPAPARSEIMRAVGVV